MANYIITNQIEAEKEIQGFKSDGYAFSPDLSTTEKPVFLRTEKSRLVA